MAGGGSRHEHIAEVRWLNPQTGIDGSSGRDIMVQWLRQQGNRAYVCDGFSIVEVRVVDARPPYIQTHADGKWTNNLLALPEF